MDEKKEKYIQVNAMYMYLNKMFIIKSIKKLYTKASTGINIICFSLSVNFLFFFTFIFLFIIPLFLVFSYIFIHWHCQVLYFYHFKKGCYFGNEKKEKNNFYNNKNNNIHVCRLLLYTIKRCQYIFFCLLQV